MDFLSKLEEQESLLRGRRPTDKVKQFMRTLLSKPEIKTKRRQLIKRLQDMDGSLASAKSSRGNLATSEAAHTPTTRMTEPALEETVTSEEPVNYERLLSDIFAIIQTKIGDDPDLYTEVCTAVQSVFETNGLLNA